MNEKESEIISNPEDDKEKELIQDIHKSRPKTRIAILETLGMSDEAIMSLNWERTLLVRALGEAGWSDERVLVAAVKISWVPRDAYTSGFDKWMSFASVLEQAGWSDKRIVQSFVENSEADDMNIGHMTDWFGDRLYQALYAAGWDTERIYDVWDCCSVVGFMEANDYDDVAIIMELDNVIGEDEAAISSSVFGSHGWDEERAVKALMGAGWKSERIKIFMLEGEEGEEEAVLIRLKALGVDVA